MLPVLTGFRCGSQVDSGVSTSGSHVHSRVPPGRCGGIYSKWRFINIKEQIKTGRFLKKKTTKHFIVINILVNYRCILSSEVKMWIWASQSIKLVIVSRIHCQSSAWWSEQDSHLFVLQINGRDVDFVIFCTFFCRMRKENWKFIKTFLQVWIAMSNNMIQQLKFIDAVLFWGVTINWV